MTDKHKAIIRYRESDIEKEEQSPLERLRYFCSLAMDGDDWVDAGHFFDSLALQVRDKVDVGPWSAGTTNDGRAFLESSDFTHDVRLYVDGDFAWSGDKLNYAKGIAQQLNTAPVNAEPVAPNETIPRHVATTLANAIYETAQKMGIANADHTSLSVGQCLHLLECMSAPVPAQPDLTQQTLDDVKAGIPARDAEIEALRKQNKDLLVQAVEDIAVIHRLGCRLAEISEVVTPNVPLEQHDTADLLDRVKKAVSAQAQQAVSGADGLPTSPTQGMTLGQRIAHVGGRENAQGYVEFGSPMAVNALIQHVLRDLHQAGTSDAPQAQQDHLPDATKMVAADQFRDAAQMIEPSGNSGELPRLPLNDPAAAYRVLHDYGQSCARAALALSHPDTATYQQAKAWKAVCAALDSVNRRWVEEDGTGEECAVKAIVNLAQQDGDKVDAALAEMVHAMFRSANSIPVTRITIDRKQYDAVAGAARKEPDQ